MVSASTSAKAMPTLRAAFASYVRILRAITQSVLGGPFRRASPRRPTPELPCPDSTRRHRQKAPRPRPRRGAGSNSEAP
jgi:hypothetical protein